MATYSDFLSIPKVELHVHLEGSIRPETVLALARRNDVALPADTLDGLRQWYQFRDFDHFVTVYVAVTKCIRSAQDIELIALEFAREQARQNIAHSEVTYTCGTIETHCGIPWKEQIAALREAQAFARSELGVTFTLILDIVRGWTPDRAMAMTRNAVKAHGTGVCALGLAGVEREVPAETYRDAIQYAADAGLPFIPHAGETCGPESIWEVLPFNPTRIGHGVRCLEDENLVRELKDRRIPLEVCPSSNVCLGVVPSWSEHPLKRLIEAGLIVTINSDDPPMFSTDLTTELLRSHDTFGLTVEEVAEQMAVAQSVALP